MARLIKKKSQIDFLVFRVFHAVGHGERAGLAGLQIHVPRQYAEVFLVVGGRRAHFRHLHLDVLVGGDGVLLLEGEFHLFVLVVFHGDQVRLGGGGAVADLFGAAEVGPFLPFYGDARVGGQRQGDDAVGDIGFQHRLAGEGIVEGDGGVTRQQVV